MTVIQLDECMDSNRLAKACSQQKLVEVIRYPKELKTKEARQKKLNKDELVLPRFFGQGRTVLTSDFPIDRDNSAIIPDRHPGIIIISNAHPTPNVDFSDIEKTINNLKKNVPQWHSLPWANSITEITLEWIEVRRVQAGRIEQATRIVLELDKPWQTTFASVLNANAGLDLKQAKIPGYLSGN